MTWVCGIDPSLTAAGVAAIAHPSIASTPNVPRVTVVGEPGHDSDTPAQTALRVRRQRERILRAMPHTVALVVIETPFPNPKAPGRFRERVSIIVGLEELFARQHIPFAEVSPSTLKLWATGDGACDKTDVQDAMAALWPRAPLSWNGKPNDNMSDALSLATIGAQHLGWMKPELPHHVAPKVRWP